MQPSTINTDTVTVTVFTPSKIENSQSLSDVSVFIHNSEIRPDFYVLRPLKKTGVERNQRFPSDHSTAALSLLVQ